MRDLTGKDLSGSDWIDSLNETVEAKVARERSEYDTAIQNSSGINDENDDDVDLNMTVKFVNGDEIISDSSSNGILKACQQFEAFVAARMAASS